ncbi:DUF2306 domain-containing protein [Aeoliella sp. SH292]|uniref:DUF2306 domain-containing protein n=1 Tax=Aeoliella sp. SH292 TaxID=3454464 RepID=UPI003F998DC9
MPRPFTAVRLIQWLAIYLVCQTTVTIVLAYRDYLPPNFDADFLLGRSGYFFGTYQWAFYAHIFSGPVTLIAGLFLLSDGLRSRYPQWHRWLGRMQVLLILAVLTPSGLWMAFYAPSATAGAGFAMLSLATALCAAMGWRTAVARQFQLHRWWMLRCYALLCSAVVLRLIGGLSEITGAYWTYPVAAWVSWIVPLVGVELYRTTRLASRLPQW